MQSSKAFGKYFQSSSELPSNYLRDSQSKVWQEYEEVLRQEKLLWFQRSRAKWITYMDHNTRYFHLVTTIRRRKKLHWFNPWWIWEVMDTNEPERLDTDYYMNLFTNESSSSMFCLQDWFPKISKDDFKRFQSTVTNEDIQSALFSTGNFKAPGADGFQAVFYES